jgi:hypothetical protein
MGSYLMAASFTVLVNASSDNYKKSTSHFVQAPNVAFVIVIGGGIQRSTVRNSRMRIGSTPRCILRTDSFFAVARVDRPTYTLQYVASPWAAISRDHRLSQCFVTICLASTRCRLSWSIPNSGSRTAPSPSKQPPAVEDRNLTRPTVRVVWIPLSWMISPIRGCAETQVIHAMFDSTLGRRLPSIQFFEFLISLLTPSAQLILGLQIGRLINVHRAT